MFSNTARWLGSTLVAAAALAAACTDYAPSALDRPDTPVVVEPTGSLDRAPELGACDSLKAPAGAKLAAHAYATGAQIYRWSGTAWVFVAPDAQLFADAGGHGRIGTHYAGPTWESNSGSKVVAAVAKRCTPDASAIAWLQLAAVSTEGPGIFHRVTHVLRVNTVGGLAPSAPGSTVGELANVPYTAEYFFYR